MIFKRLFRKAPPPEQPRPEALAEAALDNTDVLAQRAACHGIDDVAVLRQAAEQADDLGTRELAGARYRHLLCATPGGDAQLAQLLAEITHIEDRAQLEHIALDAQAPQVRHAAIGKLPENAPVLVRCTLEDVLPGNRQHAAERLSERTLLEQVLKQIGKKDTKVYRLVREKLRLLNEREERPHRARIRCEELCAQLERLGQHGGWIPDRARLTLLDREYAELEADLDAPQRDAYQQRRAAFLAGYEQHARVKAEAAASRENRAARIRQMEVLIERLRRLEQTDHEEQLASELALIAEEWSRCNLALEDPAILAEPNTGDDPAQPEDPVQALLDAGQRALERVRARQRELSHQDNRQARCQQLFAEAETLLAVSGPLDQTVLQRLQRQFAPLAEQDSPDSHQIRAVLEQLGRRMHKQQRHAERKLAAAPEQLQQLADHLDAGELRKAEPLSQKLHATLDQARAAGLSRTEINRIHQRIKELQAPLRDLQRWRRWSADQGRESLCHEAEHLASNRANSELETLAARLNHLRRDWRRIDQSGTPASETYWQRFKQATDQIAAHCEPYFQARAERQRASREARRELCEQLEHFLAAVDWNSVDWKAMARAEREMRQAWNALEPIDHQGRSGGGWEGRFRRAIARVDKALKEERQRNRAHKRGLIEHMRALADEDDLETAIANAKALQKQWHTTVAGRQQEENTLWRDFRTATDAVFARRHQQRSARHQEFQAHLDQAEAVCAQAEALGGELPAEDAAAAGSLARAWDELIQQWQDCLALPLPRQARKTLEGRWSRAQQRIQRLIDSLREQSDWQGIEQLKKCSDFLNRMAESILANERTLTREVLLEEKARCLTRNPTPTMSDPEPNARFGNAFAALLTAVEHAEAKTALAEQCAVNHRKREELCLRLEILTHLDSPVDQQSRRMELQVERLQGKLRDGDATSLTESKHLLKDWYLAAPATEDSPLNARLARIEAALKPRPISAEPQADQD